jgi:hypothetical protein
VTIQERRNRMHEILMKYWENGMYLDQSEKDEYWTLKRQLLEEVMIQAYVG